METPAALRRIREGLTNRYLRLVVWFSILLLCSTPYYGWQMMRQFLEWDNILGPQLCPDGPIECPGVEFPNEASCPPGWTATAAWCDAQADAYAAGLTFASGMEYVGGFFAGIMFDEIGPMWTAIIGCALHLLSWPLIVSGSSPAMFQSGMFLLGCSVNFLSFPSFILVDIFPRNSRFLNGVVLAAQVAATSQMTMLWQFHEMASFKTIIYWYTYGAMVPLMILYVLTMPSTRAAMTREYERKGLEAPPIYDPAWNIFLRCLKTWEAWAFIAWYVMMVAQTSYYNAQLADLTSASMAETLGYLWNTQAVFSLMLAWINDKVLPTIPVCGILNFLMIVAWCLAPGTRVADSPEWVFDMSQLVGGLLFIIQNAHIYTTKYNYAYELFPKEHFGKIAGFIGLAAGLLQQLNSVYDAYLKTYVSYLLYGFFSIPEMTLLVYLGYAQFIKKVSFVNIAHKDWRNMGTEQATMSSDAVSSLMSVESSAESETVDDSQKLSS